jgi:hypothetical protein
MPTGGMTLETPMTLSNAVEKPRLVLMLQTNHGWVTRMIVDPEDILDVQHLKQELDRIDHSNETMGKHWDHKLIKTTELILN